MRILGIDPGKKNIGVAISDPTATLTTPLTIIRHTSRMVDSASIAVLAHENEVELIVIGQALDQNGKPTVSGRSANRLAAAVRQHTDIPVVLWDESYSTKEAQTSIRMKLRKKHHGHVDDLAAAIILQSYLDNHCGV